MQVPPHWTVPARRQLLLLMHSQRAWILIALCCAPIAYIEWVRVQHLGRASFPRYPLMDVQGTLYLVSATWPLLVWRGEGWGKREYHWSLPVNRSMHDLLRFASGGAWLTAAVAACATLGLLFVHLHGGVPMYLRDGSHTHFRPGAIFWGSFFVGPLIVYTITSAALIGLRRPLEWSAAAVAGFIFWTLAWQATRQIPLSYLLQSIMSDARFSLDKALAGGASGEWMNFLSNSGWLINSQPPASERVTNWIVAVALWLGLVLLGVLLAVRRRR